MQKELNVLLLCGILLCIPSFLFGQGRDISLQTPSDYQSINVKVEHVDYEGQSALKVQKLDQAGGGSLVLLNDLTLEDGTIELMLSGARAEGANPMARGFVGLAFRTSADHDSFECFYLRATNARAENQLRRNHTVQYISAPDHEWSTLREQFPGKYESYVDMVPGEWTKVKIEVNGNQAKLFVHGSDQPTLIVNDLKLGSRAGGVGLWVGPGTVAHFAKVSVDTD